MKTIEKTFLLDEEFKSVDDIAKRISYISTRDMASIPNGIRIFADIKNSKSFILYARYEDENHFNKYHRHMRVAIPF